MCTTWNPGQQRQENDVGPLHPVKFITTLPPTPALESAQSRTSPVNVPVHPRSFRRGEVSQCLAPSQVPFIWMGPPSIGMRLIFACKLELADCGVGLKMRNTGESMSWSRVLLKSI
jgi:hypothetical protein